MAVDIQGWQSGSRWHCRVPCDFLGMIRVCNGDDRWRLLRISHLSISGVDYPDSHERTLHWFSQQGTSWLCILGWHRFECGLKLGTSKHHHNHPKSLLDSKLSTWEMRSPISSFACLKARVRKDQWHPWSDTTLSQVTMALPIAMFEAQPPTCNFHGDRCQFWVPSGNLLHSYWKWPFIVDLPINKWWFSIANR